MRAPEDLQHSASGISLQDLGRHSRSSIEPPNQGEEAETEAEAEVEAEVESESESENRDEDTTDQSRHADESEPDPSANPADHDLSQTKSSERNPLARLKRIWASNVSCEVDFHTCRDHLALERTFLGYLRTSMMMSMTGTVIAQLFTVNHHDSGFGYTLVGKPLAIVCFAFSIGTIMLGAVRSWRIQHAMIDGKALTSGFEVHLIGIAVVLLLLVFFGFLIAIDIVKIASPKAELEGQVVS